MFAYYLCLLNQVHILKPLLLTFSWQTWMLLLMLSDSNSFSIGWGAICTHVLWRRPLKNWESFPRPAHHPVLRLMTRIVLAQAMVILRQMWHLAPCHLCVYMLRWTIWGRTTRMLSALSPRYPCIMISLCISSEYYSNLVIIQLLNYSCLSESWQIFMSLCLCSLHY